MEGVLAALGVVDGEVAGVVGDGGQKGRVEPGCRSVIIKPR